MKAYCPKCEEIRTDNGEDAWGFIWHSSTAICQRCQSIVELSEQEDKEENELEEKGEEEEW